MRRLGAAIRRDLWTPYTAGILLGLVAVLTMWGANHTVGASGAFQSMAAYVGLELTGTDADTVTPSADIPAETAPSEDAPAAVAAATESAPVPRDGLEKQYTFFAFTSPKGITWMVWLMGGIFLGALASSLLSGGFRISLMPHTDQWQKVFGSQVWKRWGLVYAGSILIAIAAGIAGGCTSGLAIAQGVQLSPAAFLFIMGMFTTGPLTAALVYRRRY